MGNNKNSGDNMGMTFTEQRTSILPTFLFLTLMRLKQVTWSKTPFSPQHSLSASIGIRYNRRDSILKPDSILSIKSGM